MTVGREAVANGNWPTSPRLRHPNYKNVAIRQSRALVFRSLDKYPLKPIPSHAETYDRHQTRYIQTSTTIVPIKGCHMPLTNSQVHPP
jgi:hypothetical protein